MKLERDMLINGAAYECFETIKRFISEELNEHDEAAIFGAISHLAESMYWEGDIEVTERISVK